MISSEVMGIRNGRRGMIDSAELVPGDIIYLKSGDKVPADAILFWTNELRIDGSNLTGENEPFIRFIQLDGGKPGSEPFDCSHVVFSTDIISSGEGYAVVVQTGDSSISGRIRRLSSDHKSRDSILSMEIARFGKSIAILGLISSTIFMIWAAASGRTFAHSITFGIGMMIGWIPQGLPFTVTMILGLSGRRMAEHKVLVKDFHGIETLGAITMLATDKTGTLTNNEMQVTDVWLNDTLWHVDSSSFSPDADALNNINEVGGPNHNSKALRMDVSGVAQLMHVCITCSRARIEVSKDGSKKVVGDSTESGLLRFASERLKNVEQVDSLYPKIMELPFSSDTKTHLTIHRKAHSNGGLTLHMKGAPEKIWDFCSTIWLNGKIVPITQDLKLGFDKALEMYASKGSRVLGCCISQLPGNKYPDNYKFDTEKLNFPQV
jgi:sodium/potassium-transporting ATPase subunit alpha